MNNFPKISPEDQPPLKYTFFPPRGVDAVRPGGTLMPLSAMTRWGFCSRRRASWVCSFSFFPFWSTCVH